MKTVIVPIDFSETSLNAARYAGQLLSDRQGVNVVLYHVCDKPSEINSAKEYLDNLKTELQKDGLALSALAESRDNFLEALEELALREKADLVIMGITGRSPLGKAFIGSNAFKLIEKGICPVMIIPPGSEFRDVKNVLLTSDFKNVGKTTPSIPIKKVLKPFSPHLYVINVDSNHYVALTDEYQSEKEDLKNLLSEFDPEFYFLGWYDVDEGINQFAKDKNIDLIITVPRDHSLIEKMFKSSTTKNLAYHSSVPVLAVHEQLN